MITISKHQKLDYVLQQDIVSVLNKIKQELSMNIIAQSYESSGKYSQLHYHAIISTFTFFKFIHYKSIDGFQITWKTLNNYSGAINYIFKDTQNMGHIQDEIFSLNIYTHPRAPHKFL